MGKTLRELVDVGIVAELKKAYCDEHLAYYLYTFMAQKVSGCIYPQLRKMLEDTAEAEKEHADELADMIVKLGGEVEPDISALEDGANNPVIIPADKLDLAEICSVVAESEANAIKIYNALALKTKDTDIVVYRLVSEILSEEVDHEENFENLIKEVSNV